MKRRIDNAIQKLRKGRDVAEAAQVLEAEDRYSLYFELYSEEDDDPKNEQAAYKAASKLLGIPLDNEGHDDVSLIVTSKNWLSWEDAKKIRKIIKRNDRTINDGIVPVDAPGDYEARGFHLYQGHAGTKNFWSYDGNEGQGDWDDMADELDLKW